MRAAFCPQAGHLEVRNIDVPAPGPGEVLVRVRRCGICGSDLHFFHGGFAPPKVCPGHEICGEVVDVGAGTSPLRCGDRVAVEPLVICGACTYCRSGNYQLCPTYRIVGQSLNGGFAEFVLVPEYTLYRLPDHVDDDIGALTEPLAVGVHALRLAELRLGERVLVLGAGTIGLLAAAAARAAGAAEVWISARYPQQATAATHLGVTRIFSGSDAETELKAAAREFPVDLIIETVGGSADTLNQAIRVVRRGGRVVVLGVFTGPVSIDAVSLMVKEVRLLGSMTYSRNGVQSDFDVAVNLLAAQPEQFRALITNVVNLDDIAHGFELAGDKSSGSIKVLVRAG